MSNRDKTILIITSGAFLVIISFALFITLQTKEKMIDDGGRYNEAIFADTVCNEGEYVDETGNCKLCEAGNYCPDRVHKYECTGNTVTTADGMTACVDCKTIDDRFPYAYTRHTRCYVCNDNTHYDISFTEDPECDLGYGLTHCAPGAVYLCYYNPTTNTYVWSSTYQGGGYEVKTTITSEEECKTSKCWYNSSTNDYKWQKETPGNGYSEVSNINVETECVPTKCWYNSSTNDYKWQKNTPGNGYSEVSNINIETECVPTKCWYNSSTNDYKWQKNTPGNGYSVVSDADVESKCSAPKCYYNSNTDDYKWSKTPPTSDYHVVNSIDLEVNCAKMETDACYVNKTTGAYVWGKYEKDKAYSLVKNTSKDDCHEVVKEVPKTDMSIEIILLISMLILAFIGIGLIVYSNHIGKKN